MAVAILDGRSMQDQYWGIGRYVFNLAQGLALLAPSTSFRVLYNPRAKNTRFDLEALKQSHNIELLSLPIEIFSWREQALAFDRNLLSGAALWHAPYYALPYRLPVPYIVNLHDVIPLRIAAEMPNAGKRFIYRWLNQLAARRARAIITGSNASRNDLVQLLHVPPENISVVSFATYSNFAPASAEEIERVRASLKLPLCYALYLGINKPHKNLVRLVQAWARTRTDAVLAIAGHWDARFPEAKQEVERLGQTARILFRHEIPESELAPLLSGAQLFVFPSLHEGFGLPLLEAMACGAPVVCANVSAIPEVVGDAAVMFDPLEVEAMADAITRILDGADLRADLRARGFVRARTFSWERTARETLTVYERGLGRSVA